MKYCCDTFRFAVVDRLINKPGDKIPHTDFLSLKYFIKKYDEPSNLWFYVYAEHCPSCGKELKSGK